MMSGVAIPYVVVPSATPVAMRHAAAVGDVTSPSPPHLLFFFYPIVSFYFSYFSTWAAQQMEATVEGPPQIAPVNAGPRPYIWYHTPYFLVKANMCDYKFIFGFNLYPS